MAWEHVAMTMDLVRIICMRAIVLVQGVLIRENPPSVLMLIVGADNLQLGLVVTEILVL
jgi:hypothetical protein